jgi:cytochrome b
VTPPPARHDAAPTIPDGAIPDGAIPTRTILVWDLPTRLFHWFTVVLVAAAYVTQRLNWMESHARVGTALLALLLFRLTWGVLGTDTARFARFLTSPRAALRHLAHVFRREPDTQLGHNPAADEGPLTEMMPAPLANAITDMHTLLWDALLVAVALHLAAIALYAVTKGHNLLRPMLTGRKLLPAHVTPPRVASAVLALAVLAASTLAAALLENFL